MKQIIQQLKNLPNDSTHHEFVYQGVWYDIYFNLYRDYVREPGGEPDEILICLVRDEIDIYKFKTFNSEGHELQPDCSIIKEIENLYNF
jgi:hypothetical protein